MMSFIVVFGIEICLCVMLCCLSIWGIKWCIVICSFFLEVYFGSLIIFMWFNSGVGIVCILFVVVIKIIFDILKGIFK